MAQFAAAMAVSILSVQLRLVVRARHTEFDENIKRKHTKRKSASKKDVHLSRSCMYSASYSTSASIRVWYGCLPHSASCVQNAGRAAIGWHMMEEGYRVLVSSVDPAKYYSSELSVTACDGGDLAPRAARPRLDYVLDAGSGGRAGRGGCRQAVVWKTTEMMMRARANTCECDR